MSKIYHRGQDLFLYVQFKDEQNKPLIEIESPVFTISYEKNGDYYTLFEEQELFPLDQSQGEYCFNISLPENAEYSIYDIEYSANTVDGKVARVNENFHVIPKSEKYADAIRVYGFIHQTRVGYPLISAIVKIKLVDNSKIVAESYTNFDGRWEAYLYPGEYVFEFWKFGFKSEEIVAQIGVEHTEIQFDNVSLESENEINTGNGIYTISDNFVTREGTPLEGLTVKAIDVLKIGTSKEVAAQDITDNSGEYRIYLDPGIYLLKVNGNSLLEDFSQTFRLRIEDNGKFALENLTQNVGVPADDLMVDQGSGSVTIEDYIKDTNGTPIVDVQICVYRKNDINTLVAQDYTDPAGKWAVHLDPDTYIFEYYHPEFHEFQEEKQVK